MNHFSEEQLVLYHYGEADDLSGIREHMASCPACRADYQSLQDALGILDRVKVPERTEDYGTEVWQRLRSRLPERPAYRYRWQSFLHASRWVAVGSVAALIVAAFLIGRFWPRPETAPPQLVSEQVRHRILLVEVSEHLERSQMALIEFVNAEFETTLDIGDQQSRMRDLITSNRIYRQTAAGAGELALATVLEELEQVLLEVANGPSTISAGEFNQIRRRIAEGEIIFKVRVISSQVREREQAAIRDLARRTL
jgi:hypothetical protein